MPAYLPAHQESSYAAYAIGCGLKQANWIALRDD
jgi:hypothetical protein